MYFGGAHAVAVEGVVADGHYHGVEAGCLGGGGGGGGGGWVCGRWGKRRVFEIRMRRGEIECCVAEVDAGGGGVDPWDVCYRDVGCGDTEFF